MDLRVAGEDLLDQFNRAIAMVRFTIEEFEEDEWTSGISWFYTPARLALHTIVALEGYFFNQADGRFETGIRLGAPWWELSDDQLPNQAALLEYLADIERRIEQEFGMTPASRANLYVEGQHSEVESIEAFAARKPKLKIAGDIA